MRALLLRCMAASMALVVLAGCQSQTDSIQSALDSVDKSLVGIHARKAQFSDGRRTLVAGTGSGTIISSEGHVLTNFHVAGEAVEVRCSLYNKERVRATVVGADPWTDLAILQLDLDEARRKGVEIHPARFGRDDSVRVGDPVLALGTPMGLSRTVTSGIVSNRDRYLSADMRLPGGQETGHFNNWFQTDAAINPGNSGGPLVNLRGEIVGVNSRGARGANNIGFAVPVDIVRQVTDEILKHGEVRRSAIGIHMQPIVDLEEHYGVGRNEGVLIQSVDPDSPAAQAGLMPEDVLIAINGRRVSARFIEEVPPVRKLIADLPIGSALVMELRRGGEPRVAVVTTEALGTSVADEIEFTEWGFTAREITERMARQRRLDDDKGVMITGAREGEPARRGGLQNGDIVTRFGAATIETMAQFQEAYREAIDSEAATVTLTVRRNRAVNYVTIRTGAGGD